MIKVLFNGEAEMREVSFSRDSAHHVTLIGDLPERIDGFCTYRTNGQPLGDFSAFLTIYRRIENGIQLSDDGSVWTEPEKIEEPERTQPTQEQRITLLETTTDDIILMMAELIGGE